MNKQTTIVDYPVRSYKVYPKLEAVGAAILLFLAIFITSYFLYHYGIEAQHGEFTEGLERFAKMVVTVVDGDIHKTLVKGEEDTQKYQRAIAALRKALFSSCRVHDDIEDEEERNSLDAALRKAMLANDANDDTTAMFHELSKGAKYICDIVFIYTAIYRKSKYPVKYMLDPWPKHVPNYLCLQSIANKRDEMTKTRQVIYEVIGHRWGEKLFPEKEPTHGITNVSDQEQCGEMKSYILDDYDANETFLSAFDREKVLVTPEPYTDSWGEFFTVYAPFYDKDGGFVGVVGLDVRADAYISRFAPIKRAALRTFVMAFFLAYLVAAILWFVRNAFLIVNESRLKIKRHHLSEVVCSGDAPPASGPVNDE